jgi:hypothetical protein
VLTVANLRDVYKIEADVRCDEHGVSITPVCRI